MPRPARCPRCRKRHPQAARCRVARDLVPVLSVREVGRLLRAAQAAGPRDHALVATGYQFGLRAGEYGRLQRDRLDLDRRELWIDAEKGSRSGRQSFADPPAGPGDLADVRAALVAWLAVHPGGPWLFPAPSDTAKGLHRSAVWVTFGRLFRAADLPARAAYPHILKACLGTHLLDAGASSRYVQDRLRHVSFRSTEVYLKLTEAARTEAASASARIVTALALDTPAPPG